MSPRACIAKVNRWFPATHSPNDLVIEIRVRLKAERHTFEVWGLCRACESLA